MLCTTNRALFLPPPPPRPLLLLLLLLLLLRTRARTQGVNEMQTIVNTGRRFLHTMGNVQEHCNAVSLRSLEAFIRSLRERHAAQLAADGAPLPPRLLAQSEEQLLLLRAACEAAERDVAHKATDILEHAAALVRALGGARATCCKSAKDRTSMSTTLECARLLVLHEGLPSEALLPTADLFRAQGVRLRNCFMNVGKPRYAFNFFQRKMLPKEYRPPKETIGPVAS